MGTITVLGLENCNKTLKTIWQNIIDRSDDIINYCDNSISKDKIREKIKSLEEKIHIVIPNEYNKVEIWKWN